jgi:transposase
MSRPSDLAGEHWDLLEPVFNAPDIQDRKYTRGLCTVAAAMLHIARDRCHWRYTPGSVGPCTRL